VCIAHVHSWLSFKSPTQLRQQVTRAHHNNLKNVSALRARTTVQKEPADDERTTCRGSLRVGDDSASVLGRRCTRECTRACTRAQCTPLNRRSATHTLLWNLMQRMLNWRLLGDWTEKRRATRAAGCRGGDYLFAGNVAAAGGAAAKRGGATVRLIRDRARSAVSRPSVRGRPPPLP